MERGERLVAASVLAGLYLRGAPFPRPLVRKRWGLVFDALCSDAPALGSVAECLRDRGLFDEALAVSAEGRLEWGLRQVEGATVLTAACPNYPFRWINVLGQAAPPAVWIAGAPPAGASVSVVGRRQLSDVESTFAVSVGSWIVESGYCLMSGGAIGADTMAASGALQAGGDGRVVVILPCGLQQANLDDQVTYLSATEPNAPFSTAAAMERNALIYASSSVTMVVKTGYKVGGTWLGATDALRRRLSRIAVRLWARDQGAEALCRLGAVPVSSKQELLFILARAEEDWSHSRLFA